MKRKKKHEDHIDEGWLLPYSDMLTLLLALFIVMFAMAKVDDKKFQQIRSEFGSILSSRGGSGDAIIGTVIDMKDNGNEKKTAESSTGKATAESARHQEAVVKAQLESQQMKEISTKINNELAASKLKDSAQVALEPDGIHITLNGNILFGSGSADLTSNMNETLGILSQALQGLQDNPVVIAGHTDNVPQPGGRYASNWELSAARAISVMNYFVANQTIRANNVSIQAYADSKPKESNNTVDGRAKNRRVELLIQRTQTDPAQ